MRKLAKRLSALLLATLMLLGASLSAMAVEDVDGTDGAKITYDNVTIKVNNVQSGDTVHAYRLVEYNDQHYNSYTVESEFERYVKANYPEAATDVPEFLSKKSAADMNTILEGFATACNANTYTLPTESDSAAAVNSVASLSLQPGYYLLLVTTTEKNGRVYKPMSVFVRVDGTDKIVYGGNSNAALTPGADNAYTIQSKSENGPTLDKKVSADDNQWKDTATAGVGETAKFYVKVNIPAYADIKNMNLWVEDTLTNMKYVEGSAKLYRTVPGADNTDVVADAVTLVTNGGYQISEDGHTGTQNLKFKLDYEKIVGDNAGTAKTVYLYYEATVQKEAVRGGSNNGVNTAKLIYSNAATPGSEMETDPSTTKVFDYNYELKKFKGDTEVHLEGAKFSLYRTKEDAEANRNPIEFVADANGSDYYRPLDDSDSKDNVVTVLEANFQIRGLDAGTYYLREVETPQGYYQPQGVFQITLTSHLESNGEHGGRLEASTSGMTAEDAQDKSLVFDTGITGDHGNTLSASLKNSTTPSLPTTGGMGTMLFTIGGIALMGLAVYLFFFRKKSTAK